MNDVGLVLTGGRRGIFAWINHDGTAYGLLRSRGNNRDQSIGDWNSSTSGSE
jgi:hypothetical protein